VRAKLSGVGVALVTPFNKDGSLDIGGLERLVEYQINNGTNYLVVQGTTGESATLSKEEKSKVLETVIKTNNSRLPIVFGIGGNNTQMIVDALKQNDFSGVDAILSVSPYYNKPSQEGIYKHYKLLAENSPLPLILYNVPGRTSSNMSASTTLQLARSFENIIGIKEASGDFEQITRILKERPSDFLVTSGDDLLTLPLIALGADGVVSVIANAIPNKFSFLVHQAIDSNFKQARDTQYEMLNFINSAFQEGNPSGVKEMLLHLGVCENTVRLPLVEVSQNLSLKIKELLTMANISYQQ